MQTPRIIGVGTHHKTGTVWMDTVLSKIAKRLGAKRFVVKRKQRQDLSFLPEQGRCVLLSWSSNFSTALLDRADARYLHVVRDPRDILISGLYYHLRTENERFLHLPNETLGGRTYQEHLRQLPSLEDQFVFEMENKHHKTIEEMKSWPTDAGNTFELRYEALINDTDCALFRDAMTFAGLSGAELDDACQIFWDNSIFGGLSKSSSNPEAQPLAGHVRSGAPAQWKTKMPPSVADLYLERYGNDLIDLGYEADKNWTSQIVFAPDETNKRAQA